MERTESVINLTQSPLYSIIGKDSTDDFDPAHPNTSAQDLLYHPPARSSRLSQQVAESEDEADEADVRVTHKPRPSQVSRVLRGILKVLALSALGNFFYQMSIHLHNHSILDHSITSRPLIFGQLVLQAAFKYLPIGTESTFVLPQWAINSVEGVLFGVSQPLFDRYIMYTPIRRGSGINNVLRASMALVGIAYGVRKMEWANPMQISLMWSALNIILWGYLDTTASGFILSSIIAAVVMLISGGVQDAADALNHFGAVDHGKLAQYLWLASFYFCGAIIFGQVGRFFYR